MRCFLPIVLAFLQLFAAAEDPVDAAFERGVDAYRSGAYAEAETIWTTLFEAEGISDAARAQLAFDLGNAAWRSDRRGDAVGWYTIAVRLAPRSAEAWRNLEFARAELGFEPYDRGDLGATGRRLVTSLRASERRNLALAGLALFAVIGTLEALLGGFALRRLVLVAAALAVLAGVPWLGAFAVAETDPMLVVAERAPKLQSEPTTERGATGELVPGARVERLDELSGWVRVATDGGQRGWVPADAVFALER
ncbi:MAG: SH3 domain-containing protein [Planctomycetota bacterium]